MAERGEHDGLTQRERAVLDLWEDGKGFKAIGAALGMAPDKVGHIVSALTGASDRRTHEAAMRRGSADLLAALNTAQA